MRISHTQFAGERPAVADYQLPDSAAVQARNCLLTSGSLRPLHDKSHEATLAKVAPYKSLFLHEGYWFHWREPVNAVKAPDPGDTTGRFLFAFNDGSDSPKVTDISYGTSGGGAAYPTNAYDLGVPAPVNAPIANTAGVEPDQSDTLDPRTYLMTYVNGWGQEGPASPITPNIDVGPEQYVQLTNLGTVPSGNYNITHKRIYRTSGGDQYADFMLVAEMPVGNTSYDDHVDGDNLGDVWQTEDYDMPPADLAGIISLPNGIIAGYAKNEVCFCEPGIYSAWPQKYRHTVSGKIVALGAFGSSFVVLMADGYPYMATGDHPENYTVQRMEDGQACLAAAGVVDLGYGVAYPGPDGLQVVGVGVNKNVTRDVIEPKAWRGLNPASFVAGQYQGAYVVALDNGSPEMIVIDPATGGLTHIDMHADAMFVDHSGGKLYFSDDASLYQFDNAAAKLTYVWQGKPFDLMDPVNFGIGQVLADSYPVDLTIDMGGGEDIITETVTDKEPFRLPGGHLNDRCQIKVEGTAEVHRITVAETVEELVTGQ